MTLAEANALVLGYLIHNDPDGAAGGVGGRKRAMRQNHRQQTKQMLQDL